MKYYIAADVHGFYAEFHKALDEAGYFTDPEPHKLIILGDILDRGLEAVEMQQFILQLMEKDAVILVRGNHEDLYEEMITIDEGLPVRHHKSNGTYGTALQLTGYDPGLAIIRNFDFAEAAQDTAYYPATAPTGVRPHPRNGAGRGGVTGWTQRRPARKRRRSSAATGIAPTVTASMNTRARSSGRTRISVPTTAPG